MDGRFYQLLRKRNYELIHVTGMRIGRVRNCYDIRFVDRLFASMEFEERVGDRSLGGRLNNSSPGLFISVPFF